MLPYTHMRYTLALAVLAFGLLGAGCARPVADTRSTDALDASADTMLDLSGQGLTRVPPDVFEKTGLVELNLSGNRLTGAIPAEIRLLTALRVLDLSGNGMTGLPAEVGQLRELRTLDLSNNRLTGLPMELGQLTDLETLDLRENPYSAADLNIIRKNLARTTIIVD